MNRERTTTRLAWFLGVTFIVFGIAEVVRVIGWGGGGLAFWFLSLCGGGTMILIGSFVVTRRAWLSIALVTVGSLAASLATAWTVILPLLAMTLLVLTMLRPREGAGHASA
ncbi:MAG: hypothetical protein ACRDYU_06870 [Actinomycetes bacterium]